MSTEADLQRVIDRTPEDLNARRLLADLLEETGDPRGPGYSAFARLGRRPRLRRPIGYHGGDGKSAWTPSEIHPRNTWAFKTYNALRWEHLAKFGGPTIAIWRHQPSGPDVVDLPSDPVHSLPTAWFNACWDRFWFRNPLAMPWVVSNSRESVDNLVSLAFRDTPQAFQDHVLNCTLPVQFPFWFNCPFCGGSGRLIITNPAKMGMQDYWKANIDPFKPRYARQMVSCVPCKGKGMFREDYEG